MSDEKASGEPKSDTPKDESTAHPKALIVRDNIHGDLTIEDEYKFIIQHGHFQRLRHIGQTGHLYLVYPGMRHSRFEHSLGAFHLAKGWYNSIVGKFGKSHQEKKKFLDVNSDVVTCDGDKLLVTKTFDLYKKLAESQPLNDRWRKIVCTAALMHDVGHGPLSHTLEHLKIIAPSDYKDYCSCPDIEEFISKKLADKEKIKHEDLSLIYIDEILSEGGGSGQFFQESAKINTLCVAALVHKDFRIHFLKIARTEISDDDRNLVRLFSNIVGGLFDVDRMDYLERDSKNAGIKYGLVETERLTKALVPMLSEKKDVLVSGFICKARLVHALDHFLVCLYEMYTTLYKHPGYEGFQHEVGEIVRALLKQKRISTLNVRAHSMQTDSTFFEMVDTASNGLLTKLLNRKLMQDRDVFQTYEKSSRQVDQTNGYKLIGDDKRPIVKDNVKVWLINESFEETKILPWDVSSLVSGKLKAESYEPQIWWKNESLRRELEALKVVTVPFSSLEPALAELRKDIGEGKSVEEALKTLEEALGAKKREAKTG